MHPHLSRATKLVIGAEHHADGGQHYHVYVHFPKQLDLSDPRCFDIEEYHPNIKTFKGKSPQSQMDRWISYCKKEGNWHQEGFLSNLFTFIHWQSYIKNKADLTQWEADAKAQQLKDPFPFKLPRERRTNGDFGFRVIKRADAALKNRHVLILGPPSTGKTKWANDTFEGRLTQ